MRIEIKNGFIAYIVNRKTIVEKRNLFIDNGKVSYSGWPEGVKADKVIDAGQRVIMPGFVNAHHHIYSTLSKGLPSELPFRNFTGSLKNLWWPLDKSLGKEHMVLSTILTVRDCLINGVTTVCDHHISCGFIENSLSSMAEIFSDHGIAGSLCFEISDRNGRKIFNDSLDENIRFYKESVHKDIKGMIGLHASFTLSDESLSAIREKIGAAPIHIHIAEGGIDENQCREKYGIDIIGRLDKFGLLNPGSFLVHCSNLSSGEIDLLKSKDIFCIQAVESNMNNALSIGSTEKFLEENLRVMIGTDGMSSNILKTMKTTFLLLKYRAQNPDTGFEQMFRLINNQYEYKKRLGFDLGLEEGDEADLVILDYSPATVFDSDTFLAHFIYGITESRVHSVIKKSSVPVDNYKLNISGSIAEKYANYLDNKQGISHDLFRKFEDNKGGY